MFVFNSACASRLRHVTSTTFLELKCASSLVFRVAIKTLKCFNENLRQRNYTVFLRIPCFVNRLLSGCLVRDLQNIIKCRLRKEFYMNTNQLVYTARNKPVALRQQILKSVIGENSTHPCFTFDH